MTADPESLDRGLLLGDALFETILVRGGRPFRVERHLERLHAGCERTGIPFPTDMGGRVEASLVGHDSPYGALRITLTRGPGAGLLPPTSPEPRVYLQVRPIRRPPPEERATLSAFSFGRVDERALSAGLKTTGYLERIMAIRAAHAEGGDEALLLNSRDRLVEGSASNLFAVRDGTLFTATPGEGALPGVTRAAMLELAEFAGIPIRLSAPSRSEASEADELFLTSSLRGPVSLVRLDGEPIGRGVSRGRPGPVFLELAQALEALIDDETSPNAMASPSRPERPS